MLAVAALSGCAKKPEEIAAADIGKNVYSTYSCSQIATQRNKVEQDLENLSAEQRSAASGDTIGVILLGLPLSSMSGNDKETAIAVAKGHLAAIDAERIRKRCR